MTDKIDDILKEYDENAKMALVCEDDPEALKNIKAALAELRYSAEAAANAEEAFEKLKFNRYDAVVISEKFSGSTPDGNAFLKHLQFMPMSTRRHIFVALLGEALATMDTMAAFDKSVNVVINRKDLPNIKGILKRSLHDYEQFYKVYKESLIKMGKM
ncbi:MAG: response regulator [Alphaproteobacteria bacterium]|uniref:Response regulator n=1 Tax=Candidatus Nitrobium versatile TaxID=2884831 RepID=A0A953J9B1_9BACT|nr:response regulator [Candidatus Nitrobium versatile]